MKNRTTGTPRKRARHGLSPRERLFCEAYSGEACGNGQQSAKIAGYKGNDLVLRVAASKMLAKPHIQAELERLRATVTTKAVATREERQRFLTETMRDVAIEPKDRIKACEVLGKMQGDFVERHEVKHEGTAVVVRFPRRNA